MAYPGNESLDPAVQQRILTAFKEAVRLYRDGRGEEARTILRSITEVDAQFAPAQRLEQAIAAGSPVNLGQLIGEVTAQGGDAAETIAKAGQAFSARDFQGAFTLAQEVLRDMPGHPEARRLAADAQARLESAAEVHARLEQVRQALDAGRLEDAKGSLRDARALDPGHPELAPLERRLQQAAKPVVAQPEPEFEFEVFEPLPAVPGSPAPAAPATPPGAPSAPAAAPAAPAVAPVAAAPPTPPQPPAAAAPSRSSAATPAPAPPVTPAAPPQSAPVPLAPALEEAFTFDVGGEAAQIEFHPGGTAAAPPAPAAAESNATRVQALLDQGQHEFDGGDFQTAIDTWSRIYLLDATNAEADRRIERARTRREEVERLAEQNFYEAHEAFEQKRFDDARLLCQQVLKLVPQHLEAHDLLQRLDTPAAPPPPPAAAAAAAPEEDLFHDEFVPAPVVSSASAAPAAGAAPAEEPHAIAAATTKGAATRRRLALPPLVWVGAVVAVLALAGGGVFLLRGHGFSSAKTVVADAMAESQRLASQGRVHDAIQILQSLQGQVEGEQATRVNQQILELQRRLQVRPVAPSASALQAANQALAAGLRVKAMALVRDGLARTAGDPALTQMAAQLDAYSPALPGLAEAVASKSWESVRALAAQVLQAHPDDPEILHLWSVATFNLAVLELRRYQVADGHGLLVELCKRANDPDAERLRELAKSYLSRPVDPRYQIFVNNVELRPAE